MRFRNLSGPLVATVAVLALSGGTGKAASINFNNDVNAAIDAGVNNLVANGAYGAFSNCGDAAGLCALALLEKRVSADPAAQAQGYANASAIDKGRLDNIMGYIITRATSAGFYAYRDGADLMALSVYLRTGGPNQAGALTAIRNTFDRTAANQGGGYWCYTDGSCDDSSTTQLVMAGLAAARAVFGDPAYSDPARLSTLNTRTASTRAVYASNGLAGESCSPGGVLDAIERGHGYNVGHCNSSQQTASGTWSQLVGGAALNDANVQAYLRWIRNRYRYTDISTESVGWPSHYYYLWSSSKAYAFLEESGATPDPGNLAPADLGTLPPASAPAYARRQLHRDPATDVRPAPRGAGGAGYYTGETARWYYDYSYALMTQQGADGHFNSPSGGWDYYSDQSYALLVLQRSVGGGCIDSDDDGICDSEDNCPAVPNPGQEDSNNNGVGNACEVGPVACDVDSDGDVDQTDLNLIRAGNNKPKSSPTDPRDANGDGKINVADYRYCSLRLTATAAR